MSGDGVSLPTTISQMGSVAKTQARGQQAAQQTTPLTEQLAKSEQLKVRRVGETGEAEKRSVDPDAEKQDKRQQRRLRRQRKRRAAEKREEDANRDDAAQDGDADPERIGSLIDLRA